MKAWRVIIAVAAALVFGYVTGSVGTIIQHRNETKFGASNRQFQYEWLTVPAMPWFIIAEFRAGYDWRVDEAWNFRGEIRFWNATFWSGAALLVGGPVAIGKWFRRRSASAKTGPVTRYEF